VAFVYFKRHACDVVILETGMGGRLDSTNIIRNPLLSIITGIALDHTAFLGDTVEAIAAEKAGIIKDCRPILWGGDDPSAAAVIAETARRESSTFSAVDYGALQVTSADLSGTVFDFADRRGLSIRLLGAYQPRNACIAVRAAELLADEGLPITDTSIREGLAAARWSGRFEILTHDPLMIFDGAHNPQGIRAAVESIERYFTEKVYLLTGVLRDKDYTAIAADLATVACRAFTITPASPRALSATEYAETLRHAGMDATAYESLREGLSAAREAAARDGAPLICLGSLYLYADLVAELERMTEND
jgi:dihydrofolate synthase/folylpolyglutamate synthase